jgi:hypothetical protein
LRSNVRIKKTNRGTKALGVEAPVTSDKKGANKVGQPGNLLQLDTSRFQLKQQAKKSRRNAVEKNQTEAKQTN